MTAAQVYKAMLKGVIPVAVKVLKDQSYTSREEFQREVGLLKSLHNSNIVQFQVPLPCLSSPMLCWTRSTLTCSQYLVNT